MVADQLKDLAERLLAKLSCTGTVAVTNQESTYYVHIDSPDSALLIGHGGETLEALQTIIRLLAYQMGLAEVRIMIDVNGYRHQREEDLLRFVREVAERVKASGHMETLRPMSSYERRLVHQVVDELGGLVSESSGEGSERRITIKPS